MSAGSRISGTPEPSHSWSGKDGIRIAGDVRGNPEDPLVVLMHGGGQTRHAWKGTGERLAQAGYYTIALDARGHGDSDWASDGCYSQVAMVEDLRCVVAAIGQRPAALVGASMGGATSLSAIAEGRVEANALVLVDVAPRLEPEGIAKIQAFMRRNPDGFDSLEKVAEAIASYQPQRARPKSLDGLSKNVRLGAQGKYHWHWDPKFSTAENDLAAWERRLAMCARRLTLPTLLIRGGLSDVLSDAGAREFLAMCPQSEYIDVANAGHMVAGDRNDAFGNAVQSFLQRMVPASRKQS